MDTHVTSNALAVIPSGAISPPSAVGNVRSMEQLAKALWRRRIFIGLCGIVLGIASFAVTKQLPKRYTAGGIVTVDTHRFTVPELQGVVGADNPVDPSPQVRSETLVLRSPALLRKVVDRLDLAADPEFNPLLRPPGITDQAKALVIGVFTGEFLPEPVVTWLASWGIMLPEKTVDRPLGPEAVRELVIQSLADNLTVFNDGRSLVISVTFTSESAERSAQIVNQLFESYLGEKREVRASRNREGQAALQARLEEARNELLAAEKRVRAFREQHGIVAVRAGSVFQQHVEDLGTALARAGEERARINGNWQRAQAMASRGAIPADLADVLASSTVSRLREREAEAVRRLTELSSRLGPSHPEHRSASSELAAARAETAAESRRVVASLGEQAQSAREREADLARQLERARSQATRLSAVQGELLQLEKDSDTRRVLYQNLMQRVEQSASEPRDPQVLGVQIVSFAVAPNEPSAPKPTLSGGIGMLLGLGVARAGDRPRPPATRRIPRPGGPGAGDAPAGSGRRAAVLGMAGADHGARADHRRASGAGGGGAARPARPAPLRVAPSGAAERRLRPVRGRRERRHARRRLRPRRRDWTGCGCCSSRATCSGLRSPTPWMRRTATA